MAAEDPYCMYKRESGLFLRKTYSRYIVLMLLLPSFILLASKAHARTKRIIRKERVGIKHMSATIEGQKIDMDKWLLSLFCC